MPGPTTTTTTTPIPPIMHSPPTTHIPPPPKPGYLLISQDKGTFEYSLEDFLNKTDWEGAGMVYPTDSGFRRILSFFIIVHHATEKGLIIELDDSHVSIMPIISLMVGELIKNKGK